MQKQRRWRPVSYMGSLPDGVAKCCQVDALARLHASAFQHAIWVRHAEDQYGRSGRMDLVAVTVCTILRSMMHFRHASVGATTSRGLDRCFVWSWTVVKKCFRAGECPASSCPSTLRCVILADIKSTGAGSRRLAVVANTAPLCKPNLAYCCPL